MLAQALAWSLTLAIEVPGTVAYAARHSLPKTRAALVAILVSSITHPVVWALSLHLSAENYRQGWFLLEGSACVAEAILLMLLMRIDWRHAALLSFALNAASALFGGLVFEALAMSSPGLR